VVKASKPIVKAKRHRVATQSHVALARERCHIPGNFPEKISTMSIVSQNSMRNDRHRKIVPRAQYIKPSASPAKPYKNQAALRGSSVEGCERLMGLV
jgi:hypothetical protein